MKKDKIFLILMIFFLGWAVIATSLYSFKDPGVFNYAEMERRDAAEKLNKAYDNFLNMDGQDIVSIWNNLFFHSTYKMGGAGHGLFDCSSAFWTFFWSIGANLIYENAYKMGKRLKSYGSKIPSKEYKEMGVRNIIVWSPNSKGIAHIALVTKRVGKLLYYVDSNKKDNGAGMNNTIKIDDYRIRVYKMSFAFFSGLIMR